VAEEQWRPIAGFEGMYSVSDMGRVRSEARTCVTPHYPTGRTYKSKVLEPYDNQYGYLYVSLPVDAGKKKFRIHRLVAMAFLPNSDPRFGLDVNHKNGIRHDNRAENLEWATRSENLTHGYRSNKTPHRKAKGEESGASILTEAQVYEIRRRRDAGETCDSLAAAFGIDRTNAWSIGKRKTWKHLPERGEAA
jgi:NUMOD4 motif/HNH endonuclease